MSVALSSLAEIEPGKLYDRKDASRFLGLTTRTIQKMNALGTLPVRRIGHRVRILGTDILAAAGVKLTELATSPVSQTDRTRRGHAAVDRIRTL